MKCAACGNEDRRVKAQYCTGCGRRFTDEERKDAYDRTVYGKIDKALEAKEWITLSKITDNIFVRIAVLLVLGILVFVNIQANGSGLAIRNGDDYTLAYCRETDEYYVLTDKELVSLSVYLPKKTDTCILESYVNGVSQEKQEVSQGSSIPVHTAEDGYFLLKAYYEDGSREEILFFVCREVGS